MFASRFRAPTRLRSSLYRAVSTLSSNAQIKVFPDPAIPNRYVLTYLETEPPSHNLAIGTSTANPPTPKSFRENRRFLKIINQVLEEHAAEDADLKASAQAFASPGGATLGSGGAFFPQQHRPKTTASKGSGAVGSSAGGASAQGGAGGAGVGGWVHLSDRRNPPDFGRIAWPEDILGSVEVDAQGNLRGNFQPSGTYRIITNEGILGLSPFLTQRLITRLKEEEKKEHGS